MRNLIYTLIIAVFINGVNKQLIGQINVTPNSMNYSSLYQAFNSINGGTHGSSIITVTISGNTNEYYAASLNSGIFSSCLIKPSGVRTISGNFNDAIIVLNGADNVRIDGLNSGGNSLTLTNTNTGTGQGCIRLSNGASNNIIRNLTCNGVGSGGTIGGRTINVGQSATAIGNNDNIIENNVVNGGRRGIQIFGTTGLVTNDGTIIRSNIVKNTSHIGIFIGSETRNSTVQGNKSFFDVFFTVDLDYRAINIQGVGTNDVKGNKIYGLNGASSRFFGIISIPVLLTAPGSNTTAVNIINNMVSIADDNASSPYIFGIYASSISVPCSTNVYHNSVLISGTAANINSFTCGISADNYVTGSYTNVKNNISLNNREGGSVSTQHVGNLFIPYAGSIISADYNISIATDSEREYNGGWKDLLYNGMNAYRQAACNPTINELHTVFWNSFSFVSNTDLHIVDSTIGGGFDAIPIPGITTDIDGALRKSTDPYRGAHELPDSFSTLYLTVALQGATPPNDNVITVEVISSSPPYNMLALSTEIVSGGSDAALGGATQVVLKWGPWAFFHDIFYGCNYWQFMMPTSFPNYPFNEGGVFCHKYDNIENSFDFTTSISQSYGNNQTMYNGLAAAYNGDVNQDGVIDASDLAQIDNDANNFVTGNYLENDITRDGVVDGVDLSIADNNAFNFVTEISPIPQNLTSKSKMLNGFFKANKSVKRNKLVALKSLIKNVN